MNRTINVRCTHTHIHTSRLKFTDGLQQICYLFRQHYDINFQDCVRVQPFYNCLHRIESLLFVHNNDNNNNNNNNKAFH